MSVHSKLKEIQKKLKAPKNQKNTFGGYKYRSCEDILEAVKPLLSEQGCTLIIDDEITPVIDSVYVKATATLTDCETEDKVTATAYAREQETAKGMTAPQITGSCSSYARKYALNGLFCIDDTKDADATDKGDEPQPVKRRSRRKINVDVTFLLVGVSPLISSRIVELWYLLTEIMSRETI
mgnify:CR=1 FL=1